MNSVNLAAVGLVAIGLCSAASYGQSEYTISDIGTLGGPASHALALNSSGTVVGISSTSEQPDVSRAFRWIDGTIIDLGTLGGPSAAAFDVNDAGQITGWAEIKGSIPFNETIRAFLWQDGVMIDLGTTGGDSSRGWAINAAGTVVGTSQICWIDPKNPKGPCFPVGNEYAAVWDGAEATDLGGLLGSSDSSALGVNSSGVIVGQSIVVIGFGTPRHAVKWVNGEIMDLGTLGGVNSWAFDINDGGLIAGFSDNASNTSHHPFIYDTEKNEMIDLGLPAGYLSAEALAINAAGHVVGIAFNCCEAAAFLYDGTSMHILNDLLPSDSGWTLIEANDINDSGWIVGRGLHNGAERAFVLMPATAGCAADLDASGAVEAADLGELLAQWGSCPPPEDGPCSGDLSPPASGDGMVGPADLAALLAAWGQCPKAG